jgi:hypothetical protein
MDSLFNTAFENSLRIALLLDAFGRPQNLDMIYAADFMTIFGGYFGFGHNCLQGENRMLFSIFTSRRKIVRQAINSLVVEGIVMPSIGSEGLVYGLTETGRQFCTSLSSEYAKEYKTTAIKVASAVSGMSSTLLIQKLSAGKSPFVEQ